MACCLGCHPPPPAPGSEEPPQLEPTPEFRDLGKVSVSRSDLCARLNQDVIADALCADPRQPIDSVLALRRLLGLAEVGVFTKHAAVTHSTSLFGRHVTPLNPRVIYFRGNSADGDRSPLTALALTRGAPLIELVARDRATQDLRFYLLRFEPACGDGCTLAQKITSAAESGWRDVWFAEDSELENTELDCLRCHQPRGPGTPKMLRMNELRRPWTHWMADHLRDETGAELEADHRGAHHHEALMNSDGFHPDPLALEALLDGEGFSDQPHEFDSLQIEQRPEVWDGLYAKSVEARAMPVPVRPLRATDADRQALAQQRYLEVTKGERPESQLIDTRHLNSVDAERSARVRPSAGASGEQIIVELCGACHNSTLNQNISRARFDVDRLAEQRASGENAVAIGRLELEPTDPLHMPPQMSGELTDDERARAIAALRGE